MIKETPEECLESRLKKSNEDQLACFEEMYKQSRLTICLPTGGGKGHLMITDILNRVVRTDESIFAIATHRLMLNTQHMSDIIGDMLPTTGKIGYIFVGSIKFNSAFLENEIAIERDPIKKEKKRQKLVEFNSRLYDLKIGRDAIISSVISSPELNEKIEEHIKEGRKVVIVTTYHSLMKLGAIDIDTIYCDEAHILATNSQKEDAKFKQNFNLITAKKYYFFSATPKDLLGLREDETTDTFLMNNEEIFGKRIGITFAVAVAKGYIVEPVIHLLRPSDFEEGVDEFGTLEDKVKFIQEAFYAHRNYMRKRSAEPDKLGVKILIKCSSVTDEMWPLFELLMKDKENGELIGVKICAGASVENVGGLDIQGKHYIDTKNIPKRDNFLKELQSLKDEEEAIVLHFDILSEGINVAGFTGIMFLSGLILTITKILQNIGRTTRLHEIDRQRLINKLISVAECALEPRSTWIKPCSSVIIPYWDDKSNETRRLMATIIHDLRYRYDFNARLEVNLGDDRGNAVGEIPQVNLTSEEADRIREALVDEIEQEIEGIRVGIVERYEAHRVDNLSEDDYFDFVLNSLTNNVGNDLNNLFEKFINETI